MNACSAGDYRKQVPLQAQAGTLPFVGMPLQTLSNVGTAKSMDQCVDQQNKKPILDVSPEILH